VRDPTLAESFDAVDGDCPADARERFLTLKDEHHVQETDKPKAATNFHRFPKNIVLDCDGRPLPERQESETIATMQVRAIQQRNGNGSSSKRCNPLFRNILRASDLQSIFCGYRSISFELNPSRINILPSSIPKPELLAQPRLCSSFNSKAYCLSEACFQRIPTDLARHELVCREEQ
jgi:hypothetical protein